MSKTGVVGMAGVGAPVRRKARVERLLRNRGPQLMEHTKRLITMKGVKSSEIVHDILLDFSRLAKPHCVSLTRKNEIFPFEDANSVEFLTQKNDCSLFALGSHSKKRPHNLILGRTFDGHILDMFEFGVEDFIPIDNFKETCHKALGSKPLIVFQGEQWGSDSTFSKLELFLLDYFRGQKADKVALKGLDHVISVSIIESKIHFRVFSITYKKSGNKIPFTDLEEIGPHFDLTLRRSSLPSEEMWKAACRKPKIEKARKVKNVMEGLLGEKVGRLHLKRQDLDNMGTRKVSALRKRKGASGDEQPYKKKN